MLKTRLLAAVIALSTAVLFMPATTTWAAKAKKMSYDEAWAECKKDVTLLTFDNAARYTRGAACMKQHGYRLKKSSMSSM